MNRHHAYDLGKVTAVWGAWFWAVNWNAIAAFLSCVFTLLLILDKVGALNPLKRSCTSLWTTVTARRTLDAAAAPPDPPKS